MKVYLAAAFERRAEMRNVAALLEELGIKVTSRWIHTPDEISAMDESVDLGKAAMQDIEDVEDASTIIKFSGSAGRGGRFFEFGYAHRAVKNLVLVGSRENVFDYLPCVIQFENVSEAILALFRQLKASPPK